MLISGQNVLTLLRECERIWYALQRSECKPAGPKILSNTTVIKLPLLSRGWGGGGDSLKKFAGTLVKKNKNNKKLLRHRKIPSVRRDFKLLKIHFNVTPKRGC